MLHRPTGPSRVVAAVVAATAVLLLGLALRTEGWRPGDVLLRASYDSLHALSGEAIPASTPWPVVIVYLDLRSHLVEKQDPSRPWPRDLHAALVRRLVGAGARAVVFDVLFGERAGDPGPDLAFASALRDAGRVVLAGQASADASHRPTADHAWARFLQVEAPAELLRTNAVGWGLANHLIDDDLVVRRAFAGFESQSLPSLAGATADWLSSREEAPRPAAPSEWLRYYGPPLTIPHVSYTDALRVGGVPDDVFRDRIVFVGARPMAEGFQGRQDEFRSPFHSFRNKQLFSPGVEVHATALVNRLRNDGLRRATPGGEALVILVAALAAGLGLMHLRPAPATLAALAGAGAALGLARTAFGGGTWFPWLIVASAQLPCALFASWLFHFRDWYVTRRRLEAERRAAEARIREQAALIDKANDAILLHDLEGRVIQANPAAERLYGWSRAELCRGEDGSREAAPDDVAAARAATLARGEWTGELRQRHRSGAELVVASRWTLIRDELGAPRSLLAINSDVTEKRQLELEALRRQRTEAIGSLASGMAHDLNNALAPVLMGTQLLRRTATRDEARRILGLMEASTLRGAEMVRQVVLFARGTRTGQERLDPRPLVDEVARLARETFPRDIVVSVHVAHDLGAIRGNATELHQVLLNLAVNARDAMPRGGTLAFAVDHVDLAPSDVAGLAHVVPPARPGPFVSFLVTDTGTGIPPDVAARIFEPFFTTKPVGVGTGLGLSTSVRIVKAHDGFLSFSSLPGEGTTFEILLPRLDAGTAPADAPPADASGSGSGSGSEPDPATTEPDDAPRGHGQLVLVADDDQAVLELLGRGLRDHGYRTVTAGNGVEVLALLRSGEHDVAVVVCDLGMPLLDGLAAADAMRSARPDLPWIFMTGDGDGAGDGGDGAGERAGDGVAPGVEAPSAGAERRLAKPFPLALLLRHLRDALPGEAGPTGTA